MAVSVSTFQKAFGVFSTDHHLFLSFCGHIRTGLSKDVEPMRIRKYCQWFYTHYLHAHQQTEEQIIFPFLGNDHELVKQALKDHRKIRKLLQKEDSLIKALNALEELLEKHIRFEDHTLFSEIQEKISRDELLQIAAGCDLLPCKREKWPDEFWLSK